MSTEMASYEVVKYEPPKNQVPSKVHRYPLYKRAAAKALSPPPQPPAPAPAPAPEWSQWERVEGSQWDGWWRARPQENGGWFYQFTKDGSTIWQQKSTPSETPEPATESANTAGEDVMFKETAATALAPVPTATTTTTSATSDAMSYALDPAIAFTALALPYQFSNLTLRGNSEVYSQASLNTYAQEEPEPTEATEEPQEPRQAASTHRQKRSRRHAARGSIIYGDQATTSAVTTKGADNHHSVRSEGGKAHHSRHSKSRKAGRRQKDLGAIVSAEKGKTFDSRSIVESWQCE